MSLVQENRWEAKPRTAAVLKFVIYVLPLFVSAATARIAVTSIRDAAPGLHWLVTSLLAVLIASVALVAAGRVMRRLLPLALLLKLSLLFPDQVPSRFGIALRAGSQKRLARRMASPDGENASVAEQVLTLVAALSTHDRRTRGHSERVRAVTMLIADRMGIEGQDRDKLEWASLLHDLGKLDVPGEILNKKGKPSDEEWAVLRQHPAGGPGYAAGLAEWMGPWIHAMDQHHERYDGTGYPNGLEAGEITLSGRIVAVSDAFEVMTAIRSYKTPMSTAAARTELVKCAGSHFDPHVVRSFMLVSVGDIHRALGPMSWLTSLPMVGPVAQVVGLAGGGIVIGGVSSPALAAAAAVTLLTPALGLSMAGEHHSTSAAPDVPAVIAPDSSKADTPIEGGAVGEPVSATPTTENEPVQERATEVDLPIDAEVPTSPEVPGAGQLVDDVGELLDEIIEEVGDTTSGLVPETPEEVGETLAGVGEALDPTIGSVEDEVVAVGQDIDSVVASVEEAADVLTATDQVLDPDEGSSGLPFGLP